MKRFLVEGKRLQFPSPNMKSNGLPIIERSGSYYLRKTFNGKRKEIPLGKNSKDAQSKANRFLATFQTSGLDTAILELTGKKVIKAGCNPTAAEMETLYRDFCAQSTKALSPVTIEANVSSLKQIFKRLGITRLSEIEKNTIFKKWFKNHDGDITDANRQTFSAVIRTAKSIFKITALEYYKSRNIPLENPFKGMEVMTPAIQQYVPISDKLRESIWNNCQKELDGSSAMIVILAMSAGLRRKEIECMKLAWVTVHKEHVTITIKADGEFKPKVNKTGTVSINREIYDLLLKLRGDDPSEFFVPSVSSKKGPGRMFQRFRRVNTWLKTKGLTNQKAIHDLRKEFGSHIAKTQSLVAAAKALRDTVHVAGIHYAGIADIEPVNIQESFTPKKDVFEEMADKLGITVEEVRNRMGV